MLFAKVLYDVIKEQGSTNKAGMLELIILFKHIREIFIYEINEYFTIIYPF
jgi:hypothetical protein